jgi:hypothetical protein
LVTLRVVLVVEMAALEEVAGEAVAFRRRVPVVQVGADRGQPEAAVVGLQVVEVAHQNRLAVEGMVGRPWREAVEGQAFAAASLALRGFVKAPAKE